MALGSFIYFLIINCTLIIHLRTLWCDQTSRNYRLQVEPDHLCLEPETKTDINCSLSYKGKIDSSMAFKNWTLVWYRDGKILLSTTKFNRESKMLISRVTVHGPGKFTCSGRNQRLSRKSESLSIIVEDAPKSVKEIEEKPIYTKDTHNTWSPEVQIYWRSHDDPGKYQLVHWWPSIEHDLPKSENATCTSSLCKGSFVTNMKDFMNVSFYISSHLGQCEVRSPTWTFYLASFAFSTESNEVIFTPPSPTYLHITTGYRKVTLTWLDERPSLNDISYQYRCSSSSKKFKVLKAVNTPPARTINLSDKEIKPYIPYDECTFCVLVQWYDHGRYSQPRCNTTRLYEESPSEAPTITCTADTCQTSYEGHKRNITITWRLPPEGTWNGILTKLKVNYQTTSIISEHMELSVFDLKSNSTVVPGLNLTQRYFITMQACTKEGCSKDGNHLEISAFTEELTSSFSIITVVVLSSIGGFVIAILLFIKTVVTVKSRIQRNRPSLPEIPPPDDHEYYAHRDDPEIFDQLDQELIYKDSNANETNIARDS